MDNNFPNQGFYNPDYSFAQQNYYNIDRNHSNYRQNIPVVHSQQGQQRQSRRQSRPRHFPPNEFRGRGRGRGSRPTIASDPSHASEGFQIYHRSNQLPFSNDWQGQGSNNDANSSFAYVDHFRNANPNNSTKANSSRKRSRNARQRIQQNSSANKKEGTTKTPSQRTTEDTPAPHPNRKIIIEFLLEDKTNDLIYEISDEDRADILSDTPTSYLDLIKNDKSQKPSAEMKFLVSKEIAEIRKTIEDWSNNTKRPDLNDLIHVAKQTIIISNTFGATAQQCLVDNIYNKLTKKHSSIGQDNDIDRRLSIIHLMHLIMKMDKINHRLGTEEWFCTLFEKKMTGLESGAFVQMGKEITGEQKDELYSIRCKWDGLLSTAALQIIDRDVFQRKVSQDTISTSTQRRIELQASSSGRRTSTATKSSDHIPTTPTKSQEIKIVSTSKPPECRMKVTHMPPEKKILSPTKPSGNISCGITKSTRIDTPTKSPECRMEKNRTKSTESPIKSSESRNKSAAQSSEKETENPVKSTQSNNDRTAKPSENRICPTINYPECRMESTTKSLQTRIESPVKSWENRNKVTAQTSEKRMENISKLPENRIDITTKSPVCRTENTTKSPVCRTDNTTTCSENMNKGTTKLSNNLIDSTTKSAEEGIVNTTESSESRIEYSVKFWENRNKSPVKSLDSIIESATMSPEKTNASPTKSLGPQIGMRRRTMSPENRVHNTNMSTEVRNVVSMHNPPEQHIGATTKCSETRAPVKGVASAIKAPEKASTNTTKSQEKTIASANKAPEKGSGNTAVSIDTTTTFKEIGDENTAKSPKNRIFTIASEKSIESSIKPTENRICTTTKSPERGIACTTKSFIACTPISPAEEIVCKTTKTIGAPIKSPESKLETTAGSSHLPSIIASPQSLVDINKYIQIGPQTSLLTESPPSTINGAPRIRINLSEPDSVHKVTSTNLDDNEPIVIDIDDSEDEEVVANSNSPEMNILPKALPVIELSSSAEDDGDAESRNTISKKNESQNQKNYIDTFQKKRYTWWSMCCTMTNECTTKLKLKYAFKTTPKPKRKKDEDNEFTHAMETFRRTTYETFPQAELKDILGAAKEAFFVNDEFGYGAVDNVAEFLMDSLEGGFEFCRSSLTKMHSQAIAFLIIHSIVAVESMEPEIVSNRSRRSYTSEFQGRDAARKIEPLFKHFSELQTQLECLSNTWTLQFNSKSMADEYDDMELTCLNDIVEFLDTKYDYHKRAFNKDVPSSKRKRKLDKVMRNKISEDDVICLETEAEPQSYREPTTTKSTEKKKDKRNSKRAKDSEKPLDLYEETNSKNTSKLIVKRRSSNSDKHKRNKSTDAETATIAEEEIKIPRKRKLIKGCQKESENDDGISKAKNGKTCQAGEEINCKIVQIEEMSLKKLQLVQTQEKAIESEPDKVTVSQSADVAKPQNVEVAQSHISKIAEVETLEQGEDAFVGSPDNSVDVSLGYCVTNPAATSISKIQLSQNEAEKSQTVVENENEESVATPIMINETTNDHETESLENGEELSDSSAPGTSSDSEGECLRKRFNKTHILNWYTCVMCRKYVDKDSIKRLPCLHLVCGSPKYNCLQKLKYVRPQKSKTEIQYYKKTPCCGINFEISKGFENGDDVKEILMAALKNVSTDPDALCACNQPAEYQCDQCVAQMCISCYEAHQNFALFKVKEHKPYRIVKEEEFFCNYCENQKGEFAVLGENGDMKISCRLCQAKNAESAVSLDEYIEYVRQMYQNYIILFGYVINDADTLLGTSENSITSKIDDITGMMRSLDSLTNHSRMRRYKKHRAARCVLKSNSKKIYFISSKARQHVSFFKVLLSSPSGNGLTKYKNFRIYQESAEDGLQENLSLLKELFSTHLNSVPLSISAYPPGVCDTSSNPQELGQHYPPAETEPMNYKGFGHVVVKEEVDGGNLINEPNNELEGNAPVVYRENETRQIIPVAFEPILKIKQEVEVQNTEEEVTKNMEEAITKTANPKEQRVTNIKSQEIATPKTKKPKLKKTNVYFR